MKIENSVVGKVFFQEKNAKKILNWFQQSHVAKNEFHLDFDNF